MTTSLPPYRLTADELCRELRVSPTAGLASSEVSLRLEKYGRNELPDRPPESLWSKIVEQFEDHSVRILLAAAGVSFLLALSETDANERFHAFLEPLVILAILIANAAVGIWQDTNAEKAIEALKEYQASHANVIRNGAKHAISVPGVELVPGDVLLLKVGDKVPADSRMVLATSTTVRVDQSLLTGESTEVFKIVDAIAPSKTANSNSNDEMLPIQHQTNMLFAGSQLVYGSCSAVVTATGPRSEHGKIAAQLNEAEDSERKTPLQEKLNDFGDRLANWIMVICAVVWVINIFHFSDPAHGGSWLRGAVYYFKIAVALAVAAIPEGLPAVVTTCLALGSRAMARKNALVLRLPSVETLGCTTVICSDKTGTLTTNRMSAVKLLLHVPSSSSSSSKEQTSGDGALPPYVAEIDVADTQYDISKGHLDRKVVQQYSEPMRMASLVCNLCNDSAIVYNREKGNYERVGEPTEAALKVLAAKIHPQQFSSSSSSPTSSSSSLNVTTGTFTFEDKQYTRTAMLEFTRERKSMSVILNQTLLLVKGAPESILDRCSNLTPQQRAAILNRLDALGLRSIALAYRNFARASDVSAADLADPARFVNVERDLTYVGTVGIVDPPREGVDRAIATCQHAGIRVVMITGDNRATAEAVARKIGIASEGITGREWSQLSDADKNRVVQKVGIFSRVVPADKLDIVRRLRALNEVVAMTGDGVNDASALKEADIGVAMGSGTDVAKGAADMVLADDNFATIVEAVREGRAIYANMKQFIRYLISSNIGEVVCIFLTALLGMPEALVPVQLLWVNLVTDGLPATALGFNPPDPHIMRQTPRGRDDPIVTRFMFVRYLVIGCYVGLATIGGFAWWYMYATAGPQMSWAQLTAFSTCEVGVQHFANGYGCEVFGHAAAATVALSVLVTIEMFNACNAVSEDESMLRFAPWTNGWLMLAIATSFALHFCILHVAALNEAFGVVPLGKEEWLAVVAWSAPVVVIDEVLKAVARSRARTISRTGSRKSD